MTKQKFPREGVQQKWFEGDCCGTHTEQSSNRRADTQPRSPCQAGPRAAVPGPRGQTMCAGTEASVDKGLREPLLHPPPHLVGGGSMDLRANIWTIGPEAEPTLVTVHFPVPYLKAD